MKTKTIKTHSQKTIEQRFSTKAGEKSLSTARGFAIA